MTRTAKRYFSDLESALNSVNTLAIDEVGKLLAKASRSGQRVFVAGNGGSASTSSHFATDLGVGSISRRNPISAISLTDNSAVLTATANDFSFSEIFSRHLSILGNEGDIFLAISASGNSENLINAVKTAKGKGITSISLTGFDGGVLKNICDLNIHVNSGIGDYGVVEDAHLSICHFLTEFVRSYEPK